MSRLLPDVRSVLRCSCDEHRRKQDDQGFRRDRPRSEALHAARGGLRPLPVSQQEAPGLLLGTSPAACTAAVARVHRSLVCALHTVESRGPEDTRVGPERLACAAVSFKLFDRYKGKVDEDIGNDNIDRHDR